VAVESIRGNSKTEETVCYQNQAATQGKMVGGFISKKKHQKRHKPTVAAMACAKNGGKPSPKKCPKNIEKKGGLSNLGLVPKSFKKRKKRGREKEKGGGGGGGRQVCENSHLQGGKKKNSDLYRDLPPFDILVGRKW